MPKCLAIGIEEGAFWDMNIAKLRPYLIAENIRRENQNFNAWLSGMYVYDAVTKALAASFGKKGRKPPRYMEKPVRITPYTEEERAEMAIRERKKAIAFFTAMEKNFNAKEEVMEHGE